jgi:predicted dehydrogenase
MTEPAGRKIGVGIVGAGMVADWHAAGVREHGGAVVAVFDVQPQKAQDALARWEATRVAESLEDLVSDPAVDAVVVATPPAAHAAATIAALEAGKHVLCEKPFALDVDEARAMARAADCAAGFLACASSRHRGNPVQRTARRLIDAGELGDVYHVHERTWRLRGRPGHHYAPQSPWFLDASVAGGGVIMDIGVYAIDSVLWLLSNPVVRSVTAQTRRIPETPAPAGALHDVEDHAVIMLQCAGGRSALIEVSWVTNSPADTVTVLGTKAALNLDPFARITANQVGDDDSAGYNATEEPLLPDPTFTGGNVTTRFLADVEAGVQPQTAGAEAVEITTIIDAAYRSAEAGTSIALSGTSLFGTAEARP